MQAEECSDRKWSLEVERSWSDRMIAGSQCDVGADFNVDSYTFDFRFRQISFRCSLWPSLSSHGRANPNTSKQSFCFFWLFFLKCTLSQSISWSSFTLTFFLTSIQTLYNTQQIVAPTRKNKNKMNCVSAWLKTEKSMTRGQKVTLQSVQMWLSVA